MPANPVAVRRFDTLSAEAKDTIFDATTQIFHDAAFAWQLIDQNDPEEAEDALNGIKARVDEMLAAMEPHRISPPAA